MKITNRVLPIILAILLVLELLPAGTLALGENELEPEEWMHVIVYVPSKEATCTENGNIAYFRCTGCGKLFSDKDGNNEITQESTVVKAKGHSPSSVWSFDAEHHWHLCANGCGTNLDEAAHTWNSGVITKEATESEPGTKVYTCSVCGATLSENVPVINHVHTPERVPAKAPTESEDGNIEYWRCRGCGLCFADESCLISIAKDSTVIPATGSSSAAVRDAKTIADALHSLSLFLGTGDNPDGTPNYSLDRGLTRAQSLVLLIRMLGKEQVALAAGYPHPFIDTDEWYDSYVGYGYMMKLTNGTGATTYSGAKQTTAQMFATFCLRALGYDDMGAVPDFYWEQSCEMAESLGIEVNTEGDYLRRDAAKTFWDVLGAKMKNSDMTLADKLISEGVFTRGSYENAVTIAKG